LANQPAAFTGIQSEDCAMQATNSQQKAFALLFLGAMGWNGLSMANGAELPLSEPLDETVVVHEQLTSGEADEADEVPPEPVPPNEYQPLDSRAPALVAEEILRLRDSLGTSPLAGRPGFRPLTLANESDEDIASPAPWEREDDRRDFRDRLQGMASRPVLAQPHGVPYGVRPYHFNPPAYIAPPAPQVHLGVPWNLVGELQPRPVQIPYGYEPVAEGCHMPVSAPSFVVAEMQGQKQIDILRQTAHQLDETAHQLECCEQFERADQVRQLAEQLRQDARRGRRAEEATAMRTIQPAAGESAEHLIRAALRARYTGRLAEEPTFQREETNSVDAEPSCPACPTLQRNRRGVSVEESAANPE
jgi:hypothetical protein